MLGTDSLGLGRACVAECEYFLGWKGGTTEVTSVSQVVEDSGGVGGPQLAAWPYLGWAPCTPLSWPSSSWNS